MRSVAPGIQHGPPLQALLPNTVVAAGALDHGYESPPVSPDNALRPAVELRPRQRAVDDDGVPDGQLLLRDREPEALADDNSSEVDMRTVR